MNTQRSFSGLEKPFDDNLAYSSHNYTVPGFGPGQYPGTIHPRSAAAGSAQDWDLAKQERNFLDAEGTKFTQQHNVPLWVGEFGSVFNGPANESGDRLRALDDQIGIFESHETHWTTWNYKDVGVMGMLKINPASPYMERISDLLRKKVALGTDDWMKWLPTTQVKDATAQLADQIRQVVGDPQLDARLNVRCMSQTLLCFYTEPRRSSSTRASSKACPRMSWITSYLPFRQSSACQTKVWWTSSVNIWPRQLRCRVLAVDSQRLPCRDYDIQS